MKRGQKFLIAFGAAAITFGSLYATMGPREYGRHHFKNGWGKEHRHGHCHMDEEQNNTQPTQEQPAK